MTTSMDRRTFLTGAASAAGLGALATMGLTGCTQKTPGETSKEANGDSAMGQTSTDQQIEWLGTAPEIAESEIVSIEETDFLIVGAGAAGMVAAATACELGLDFTICEKNAFTAMTKNDIGAVDAKPAKEAGATVNRLQLLNEFARYSSFKCNMDLVKVWINESAETFEWLEPFMAKGGKKPMFMGPNFDDPYESEEGGGKYYVPPISHRYVNEQFNAFEDPQRNEILATYIEEQGKPVRFGHRLVKLIREDDNAGRVSGAIFQTKDGYVQINAAKGLLLATGGYQANPTMIKALQPMVQRVVTTNGYGSENDGEGIRSALWIGADKQAEGTSMIFNRGGVTPGTPAGYQTDDKGKESFPGPFSQVKIGSQPFLKVNREGKRFCNESCPYDYIVYAGSNQTDGVWCQIFDANAKEDIGRFATFGCSDLRATFVRTDLTIDDYISDWEEAGIFWKADTIQELAEKLQLPYDELQKSIDRYNELYEKQVDEDYGKEAYRLSAIKEPPFYGAWFGGNLLCTLDGLRINTDMQVLDKQNQVIEGLYAAGDCSGGMFSGNYPEYFVGCALGRTITFARHVARKLAGDL